MWSLPTNIRLRLFLFVTFANKLDSPDKNFFPVCLIFAGKDMSGRTTLYCLNECVLAWLVNVSIQAKFSRGKHTSLIRVSATEIKKFDNIGRQGRQLQAKAARHSTVRNRRRQVWLERRPGNQIRKLRASLNRFWATATATRRTMNGSKTCSRLASPPAWPSRSLGVLVIEIFSSLSLMFPGLGTCKWAQ